MRGGKREGAGRPKSAETVTIRVPVKCLPEIEKIIIKFRNKDKLK